MASLQLPSEPALALTLLPSQEPVTVTVAPGEALPQRGASVCCWSTMWSQKKEGRETLAPSGMAAADRARTINAIRFIVM